MSKDSIRTLLDAQGSFPDAEVIRANVESLLASAHDRSESVEDLAWGFLHALDQWSQVGAVDPTLARRLREWTIANWTTTPHSTGELLGALLVNVPSPEAAQFLRDQRDRCADPDFKRTLARFIADA
jgi:hypothetical protein